MTTGANHDRITLISAGFTSAVVAAATQDLTTVVLIATGYITGGYVFSPDCPQLTSAEGFLFQKLLAPCLAEQAKLSRGASGPYIDLACSPKNLSVMSIISQSAV